MDRHFNSTPLGNGKCRFFDMQTTKVCGEPGVGETMCSDRGEYLLVSLCGKHLSQLVLEKEKENG